MSSSDHLGYSSRPDDELTDFEVRRRQTTWSGRQGVLEVGGIEVPCTVIEEPTWRTHGVDEIAVTIESATTPSVLRYSADARLSVAFDDGIELVFVGPIKTVEWSGGRGCVTLISPMVELEEVRIGGAVFWGARPGEIGPLVQRLLGRRDVVLDAAALRGGDVTFVICPVDGLEPTSTFLAGQVVFTHDSALVETAMPTFGDPALLVQMSEATCWAVAVVGGSVDHASTVQGQRLIDSALAWLMVVHSLGRSAAAGATGLPYDRTWVRSRPTRRDVTLACSDGSGQRHLGGGVFADEGPSLTDRSAMALPELPTNLSREPLVEGLLAWRRSVESESKYTACSALSEAVECLLSGVKTDVLFDDEALDLVRDAVPDGLSEDQQRRLNDVWPMLNQPSFMSKLMGFLDDTGIVAEPEDLAALKAVRKARNDFVHGRGSAAVNWQDVRRTRAFVARLLTEAVTAAAADTSTPPLGLIRVLRR